MRTDIQERVTRAEKEIETSSTLRSKFEMAVAGFEIRVEAKMKKMGTIDSREWALKSEGKEH